jgi:hypothetical protein
LRAKIRRYESEKGNSARVNSFYNSNVSMTDDNQREVRLLKEKLEEKEIMIQECKNESLKLRG